MCRIPLQSRGLPTRPLTEELLGGYSLSHGPTTGIVLLSASACCPSLPRASVPPPASAPASACSPPAPRSASPRAAPSLRSHFRPRLLCSLFLALASLSVPARASESAEPRQQALAQPALGSSVASVSGGFPARPLPQVRARAGGARAETEVLPEAPRRPLEGSGLQRQRLQGRLPPLTLSHLLILGNKPVLSKQNSLLQMRVKQLLILASMAFALPGSEEPAGWVSLVVVACGERCQT